MQILGIRILLTLSSGLSSLDQKTPPGYYQYETIYNKNTHFPQASIRVVMGRLIDEGFVDRLLKNESAQFFLTTRGKKILIDLFGLNNKPKHWVGSWYMGVEVGPPSSSTVGLRRVKGEIKISPFPQEESKSGTISFSVRGNPVLNRELLSKIWHVDNIKSVYERWLIEANIFKGGNKSLDRLLLGYKTLVSLDPRLPKGLIPPDWPAGKAKKRFIELVEDQFGE